MKDIVNKKNIEIGKRFKKVRGEDSDLHKIGSEGVILNFIGPMPANGPFAGEYGYIVKFDDDERIVFIGGHKIEEI